MESYKDDGSTMAWIVKRPKKDETEEDCLRLQEKFLASQTNDRLLAKKGKDTTKMPPVPKSPETVTNTQTATSDGKPNTIGNKKKKMSLFAKRMLASGSLPLKQQHEDETVDLVKKDRLVLSDVHDKGSSRSHRQVPIVYPSLISGLGLRASSSEQEVDKARVLDLIHDENVRILSGLSEEEILAERERIAARLSPDLVQFVRNRGKGSKGLCCEKSSASFTSSSGENLEKNVCISSHQVDDQIKENEIREEMMINDRNIENKVPNDALISSQTDYDDNSSILKSTDESVWREVRINAKVPTEVSNQSWSRERLGLVKNTEKYINLDELQEISNPVDLSKAAERYEWMHMTDVEKHKLEWVCEPVRKTSSGGAGTAAVRFGFDGELVADSPQRWEREELYHHGDEPDKAGYALQDLFVLLRSTFVQQQLVGLKTLSRILDRAKSGYYHGKLSRSIVPTLVDSGIVVLARLALDSPLVAVHEAAAGLFRSLLVNADDELALDQSFTWYRGQDLPAMNAAADADDDDANGDDNDPDGNDDDDREEKEQPTDEEVIRKDLIKGLLVRTSFLPRLNYLVTVHQPRDSSKFIEDVLDVLTRAARHHRHGEHLDNRRKQDICGRRGKSDPSRVYECPGLLKNVVERFLPLDAGADHSQPTELRSAVSAKVIKLLRTLAASDACVARELYRDYGENVFQHICSGSQLRTCHEALRFWTVLLRYGFGTDRFQRHSAYITERLSSLVGRTRTTFDNEDPMGGCLAMSVVEAGFNVAAEVSILRKAKRTDPVDESVLPEFQWSNVVGYLPTVLAIAEKSIEEFVEKYFVRKYTTYGPLTSAMNCLSAYIEKGSREIDPILYDRVRLTLKSSLLSCLESCSFKRTIEKLRENSVIIRDVVDYRSFGECADSFRTLESIFFDDSQTTPLGQPAEPSPASSSFKPSLLLASDLSSSSRTFPPYSSISHTKWHPVVHPLSAVPFLSSVVRLVSAWSKLDADAERDEFDLLRKFLFHQDLQLYLTKIGTALGSALKGGWFSRFEVHVVYFLVTIAKELLLSTSKDCRDPIVDPVFYNKIALNLLTHFQSGDELMVLRMFNVLLSEEFLSDVFGQGDIEENLVLETNRASKIDCISADLRDNLKEMKAAYVDQFFDAESAERSSKNLTDKCLEVNCMVVGRCGKAVLPVDWLYQPLLHLNYVWKKSRVKKHCDDVSLKNMLTGLVKTCQQAVKVIFLLEKFRDKMISHISVELKIARIMQAAIAAGEELLSVDTYFYIDQLVQLFSTKKFLPKPTDRSVTAAGVSPPLRKIDAQFYDMYLKEYVGFFAPLLTFNVITLFPLVFFDGGDGHGSADQLWHLLWFRNLEAVKYLPIGFDQLPFSIEPLLKPQDQDNLPLIKCYFNCLGNRWLSHAAAPVPYLIAVHNVNRFIYSSPSSIASTIGASENGDASRKVAEMENAKKLFARQVFTSWPDAQRKHVLAYKQADFETPLGFDTYDVLPKARSKRLISLAEVTAEDVVLMLQK